MGVPLYVGAGGVIPLLLPPQPTAKMEAPTTSSVKMDDALRRLPGSMNTIPSSPKPVKGNQAAKRIPECESAAAVDAVVVMVTTTSV